jgi:hypothetical protein
MLVKFNRMLAKTPGRIGGGIMHCSFSIFQWARQEESCLLAQPEEPSMSQSRDFPDRPQPASHLCRDSKTEKR